MTIHAIIRTNKREDAYGSQDSPAARCRFALEVIDAVCAAVGPTKTAIRLSPWSRFYGMREKNPIPTFSYLLSQIKERQPKLSYVHLNGHTEELPPGISLNTEEERAVKDREADIERPSTACYLEIWPESWSVYHLRRIYARASSHLCERERRRSCFCKMVHIQRKLSDLSVPYYV